METGISPGKQIRNLLLVLGSGIGCAILLALLFLYYYNPSGTYLARNVLLSPESAAAISFNQLNRKSGGVSRFVFDDVEFTFFNKVQKSLKTVHVDLNQYNQFYQMVGSLRSVEPTDEILSSFSKPNGSTLALKIRPENNQTAAKTFIAVNFVNEGDYFRIELHEQSSTGNWAYFYYPGIYQKVIDLFVPAL